MATTVLTADTATLNPQGVGRTFAGLRRELAALENSIIYAQCTYFHYDGSLTNAMILQTAQVGAAFFPLEVWANDSLKGASIYNPASGAESTCVSWDRDGTIGGFPMRMVTPQAVAFPGDQIDIYLRWRKRELDLALRRNIVLERRDDATLTTKIFQYEYDVSNLIGLQRADQVKEVWFRGFNIQAPFERYPHWRVVDKSGQLLLVLEENPFPTGYTLEVVYMTGPDEGDFSDSDRITMPYDYLLTAARKTLHEMRLSGGPTEQVDWHASQVKYFDGQLKQMTPHRRTPGYAQTQSWGGRGGRGRAMNGNNNLINRLHGLVPLE